MGLKKWIARKGAVGSTARWAAKLYKALKKQYPEKSDKDIYKMMINKRYKSEAVQRAEKYFFSMADDLIGLRTLVTTVLDIEADFTQNTFENQNLFIDVIEEELQKEDLSDKVIKGE